MSDLPFRSEIRESVITELLNKVEKGSYEKYLKSIMLERIRGFRSASISFDFPVTALIGANGSGKSTVLQAAGCAYSLYPGRYFQKSRIGDSSMDDWIVEYHMIDRTANLKGVLNAILTLNDDVWNRNANSQRAVKFLSITRTVPVTESPLISLKNRIRAGVDNRDSLIASKKVPNIEHITAEAEKILGKSLSRFELYEVTSIRWKYHKKEVEIQVDGQRYVVKVKTSPTKDAVEAKQLIFVGKSGDYEYSEFNFGAGESSVIRMVSEIEKLEYNALVLIEEIENGLHPIATRRMVEYLISVAQRKRIQVIFTTHSDYALDPLPPQAIWSCMNGTLQQGKLSVEVLRNVTGRIEKRLAIFVEDAFAKAWVETMLRETLGHQYDELEVYALSSDSKAIKAHQGHLENPAVSFRSVCILDGDSSQKNDPENFVFRLPGKMPEDTVFSDVLSNLDTSIEQLCMACQCTLMRKNDIASAIRSVSLTNRDKHVIFNQVGEKIGNVSESIVRGAFLTIWMQNNLEYVAQFAEQIRNVLDMPTKKPLDYRFLH